MSVRQLDLRRFKWMSLAGFLTVIVVLAAATHALEPYLQTWQGRLVWTGIVTLAVLFPVGIAFMFLTDMHRRLDAQNRELLAIGRAARDIHGELELEIVLQRIVDQARELLDARYGALSVNAETGRIVEFVTSGLSAVERERIGEPPQGKGLLGVVLHERRHLRLDDLKADPRSCGVPEHHPTMASLLAVPILCQGPFRGNLYLANKEAAKTFSEADEEMLVRFAATAAVAIDKSYLHHELENLAVAEERGRIGREMHDGMAQVLAYVNTKAQAVQEFLRAGKDAEAGKQLDQLAAAAREAYSDVREGILALRSQPSGERQIAEVLREYFAHWQEGSGIPGELAIDDPLEVSPGVELQMLRVVQEALANVRKHADADRVQVSIRRDDKGLIATVEDDGAGFDPASVERAGLPRFGLTIMKERAESAGGTLEIQSSRGAGTCVRFEVPIV